MNSTFMTYAKGQAPDILSAPQAALIDEIKFHFNAVHRSHEAYIEHAFICGVKLHQLKASTQHGDFMPLREKYFSEISKSAAGRFMQFTDLLAAKFPAVGNLKQLAAGELAERDKKAVMKAVYEAADGKTWTAFYRDLNLSKQREKGGFHPPTEELIAWLNKHHSHVLTDHKTPYPLAKHITFDWLKQNYPEVAAAFKKQWKGKPIPSDVIAEGHRREGRKLLASIHEALDDKKRAAAWDEELRAELKTAAFELWKSMKASLKGRKPKRGGKK